MNNTVTIIKKTKKKFSHPDWGYFVSAGIPATIFLLIKIIYLFSVGKCLPTFLSPVNLIFLILAAVCFYFFIKHSPRFTLKNKNTIYIFITAYSCCSYGMLQENSISSLLLYATFPLIFYFFEMMIAGKKYLPFVIACSVMLYVNPETEIQVILLLFILSIMILIYRRQFELGNLLHIILLFLFIVGLGAARFVFYIAPYIAEHAEYTYDGFSLSYSPFIFLGRFLPGAAASRAMVGTDNRMDLYFGLFPLLCFFIYFITRTFPLRQKIYAGAFTLLIISLLEFSPVLYLFNLFHITYHSTLSVSFFLVFWMLYLGMLIFQKKPAFSKIELFIALFLSLFLITLAWLWGAHNFHKILLPICVIFLFIYTFCSRHYTKKWAMISLSLFVVLEMGMNIYFSTNQLFYNTSISTSAKLSIASSYTAKNDNPEKLSSNNNSGYTADQYSKFINEHKNDDIVDHLNTMFSLVSLSDQEKKKYCGTIFPDVFQELNGICKKIGISNALFTPVNFTITFKNSNLYHIVDEGHHIYNITSADGASLSNYILPFTLKSDTVTKSAVFQKDNLTGNIIQLDHSLMTGKTIDLLPIEVQQNASTNFQILIYKLNKNSYSQLIDHINTQNTTPKKAVSYLVYDYIGIALSIISAMLLITLCFYDKKEAIYFYLESKKGKANHAAWFIKLKHRTYQNRFFILSFIIPFALFIIAMIVCDAIPFGDDSMFDADGTWSSIPSFLDHYYKYKTGNKYLSMNIGYGSDLSLTYTIHLLSKLYHFLPLGWIVPMMEFLIAVCLGLCGLNMAIYMTHRHHNSSPAGNDFRLLIPSGIYSLNAYMLAVHCYPTWYFTLLLFPLIMLFMDQLMLNRHWIIYSVLLGLAILLEIQLAIFICIFLVINFFTYHFDNPKDFFIKGFQFISASLLAGGCGFLTIVRTFTAYQTSGYTKSDSVIATLGFHGSFWAEWQKFLIFTPTEAASSDPGNVSIYCGVITLLLSLLYLLYSKQSLTNRLRRLVPVAILLVSFNGQLLSYLWNGMHYQSNCPNRYVFLLMFLLAELAYDGFLLLPNISKFHVQAAILSIIIFLVMCYTFGTLQITLALLASLAILIILYIASDNSRRSHRQFCYPALTFLILIELGANMIYTTTTWNHKSIQNFGNYQDVSTKLNQAPLRQSNEFFRIAFIGSRTYNKGEYYNTGCLDGFGTCLSNEQLQLHADYGFNSTSNGMSTEYASSPVTLSNSSCKYLFLPVTSDHSVLDLEEYNFLGIYQDHYVFENKEVSSLGIYYPAKALNCSLTPKNIPEYYNQLSHIYSTEGTDLYSLSSLKYTQNPSAINTYYFTDHKGNSLSGKQALKLLRKLETGTAFSSQIKMHINCSISKSGVYYISVPDFVCLGKLKAGKNQLVISLPSSKVLDSDKISLLYYNKNASQQLMNTIHKNQLTNIKIQNDSITGKTNYSKNGYTIYSLAYSKSWHAYVDGKEVKTLNPYNSALVVPTPAGKHTVTLKFEPQHLKICQIITLLFWLIVMDYVFLPSNPVINFISLLQNRQFSVK